MRATLLALASAVLLSPLASANPVADIEAQLALCQSCHEPVAGAPSIGPSLDGQKSGYLRKQLFEFRSGARNDPQMSPVAKTLTDEQIELLVRHYAERATPASAEPGMDPTTRPLVYCVRCHGAEGVSPNDIWPNLVGLDENYMRKQVQAFASGERRDDMMASWGKMIQGDEMERILRYFSELGRTAP